jgi:hypothetical protein
MIFLDRRLAPLVVHLRSPTSVVMERTLLVVVDFPLVRTVSVKDCVKLDSCDDVASVA